MDSFVRHVNLTDEDGQVYCHQEGGLVVYDGEHIHKSCWSCPYWSGVAKGYGVECSYEDVNVPAGIDEVSMSKPEDALAAAPPIPKSSVDIASPIGIAARDARVVLAGQLDEDTIIDMEASVIKSLMQSKPEALTLKSEADAVVQAALSELDAILNGG